MVMCTRPFHYNRFYIPRVNIPTTCTHPFRNIDHAHKERNSKYKIYSNFSLTRVVCVCACACICVCVVFFFFRFRILLVTDIQHSDSWAEIRDGLKSGCLDDFAFFISVGLTGTVHNHYFLPLLTIPCLQLSLPAPCADSVLKTYPGTSKPHW